MMSPGSGERYIHNNEYSIVVDNCSVDNEEVTRIANMQVEEIELEVT